MTRFIGKFLELIYNSCENGFLTILIYTVFVCLVFMILTNRAYKNINISKKVRPEFDALEKKYRKDQKHLQEKLNTLLLENGFTLFSSTISSIIQAVFGVIMALAIVKPNLYIFLDRTVDLSFFGIDPAISLYSAFKTGGPLIGAIIIYLCALVLQYSHDKIMQKDLIADQKFMDTAVLVGVAIGGVLFPIAFCLYWTLHEIIDITAMYVITKKNITGSVLNERKKRIIKKYDNKQQR